MDVSMYIHSDFFFFPFISCDSFWTAHLEACVVTSAKNRNTHAFSKFQEKKKENEMVIVKWKPNNTWQLVPYWFENKFDNLRSIFDFIVRYKILYVQSFRRHLYRFENYYFSPLTLKLTVNQSVKKKIST